MPTTAELETLAVMLDSASYHMQRARTADGGYVWGTTREHGQAGYAETVSDMFAGFYSLQLQVGTDFVHITH